MSSSGLPPGEPCHKAQNGSPVGQAIDVTRSKLHLRGLRGQMVVGFGVKGFGAVTSFAFTWLVARAFGPAGVGAFGTALTTAQMLVILSLIGLDTILVRTVAVCISQNRTGVARTAVRHATRVAVGGGLVLMVMILLFHQQIAANLLGSPAMAPDLLIMAFLIPVSAYCRLVSTTLRGMGDIGKSQMVDGPLGTFLGGAMLAGALLIGVGHNPLLPSVLYLAGWLVTMFVATIIVRRMTRDWAPAEPLDRPMLRPGFMVLITNVNNFFVDWFATVILAVTHGPAEAGLFRVGYQIASSLKLLSATSETILHPVFAASYEQGDVKRIARIIRITILALLIAASPIALAVLVAPHWIMGLFGKQFTAGAAAMQVLVLGQVFGMVFASSGGVLVMANRERLAVVLTMSSVILAAILALVLIPPYGALGAAIAIAVPSVFLRFVSMVAVRLIGIPII